MPWNYLFATRNYYVQFFFQILNTPKHLHFRQHVSYTLKVFDQRIWEFYHKYMVIILFEKYWLHFCRLVYHIQVAVHSTGHLHGRQSSGKKR